MHRAPARYHHVRDTCVDHDQPSYNHGSAATMHAGGNRRTGVIE
ncbi:MAG TPA: hypothetical protein VL242_52280 [Sorangium sp.]|nr:hypothetical protein [Sorangium sp.]